MSSNQQSNIPTNTGSEMPSATLPESQIPGPSRATEVKNPEPQTSLQTNDNPSTVGLDLFDYPLQILREFEDMNKKFFSNFNRIANAFGFDDMLANPPLRRRRLGWSDLMVPEIAKFDIGRLDVDKPLKELGDFGDIQDVSKVKKILPSEGPGQVFSQTYLRSAKRGDDGKLYEEKYISHNNAMRGEDGNMVAEIKQSYHNDAEDIHKLAQERYINDKGRKVVHLKTKGSDVHRNNYYLNMDHNNDNQFDEDWNQNTEKYGFYKNSTPMLTNRIFGRGFDKSFMEIEDDFKSLTYDGSCGSASQGERAAPHMNRLTQASH